MVVAGAGAALLSRSSGERSHATLRNGAVIVGISVVAALGGLAVSGVLNRVLGVERSHPEQMVYLYDLAAMSQNLDEQLFDDDWVREPNGWGEQIYSLRALDRRFDWKNVITVFPPLGEASPYFKPDPAATPGRLTARLRSMWVSAVTSHPLTYAEVRLRVILSSLGFFGRPIDAYPFTDPMGGPLAVSMYGSPPKFTNRNRQARSALAVFAGPDSSIPVDIGFVYVLLGFSSVAYLWVRWRGNRDRDLLLAIGAFEALTITVLLASTMATSYRYLAVLAPVSMVLAAWAIRQFVADRAS
jgi:hypothetical protein